MAAAAAPVATQVPQQEKRAYYGDLHLHTSYSFDAYITGTRIGPDEAYRFARGETVTIGGVEYRRTTPPLDFLAVTDHAEWMNVPEAWQSPESPPFLNEIYRKYSSALKDSVQAYMQLGWPSNPQLPPGADMAPVTRAAWQRQIEAANRHYRPGEFTTLLGYEWTSQAAGASDEVLSTHRNVIFKGGNPPVPFTSIDSDRPEALWTFLNNCRSEGHEALAIVGHPHSSREHMFDGTDSNGRPMDATHAEAQAANEVLLEITQNSGDSEAHPELSPADEFAGLGRGRLPAALSAKPHRGSFARYALSAGMRIEQSHVGINPYRFGFIGSSDFHNGRSDSAESAAGRAYSGSLTGVWAESNTREAIFAALQRKETFATSGTRLQLRFFGGWDYDRSLLGSRNWVRTAYRDGVSMGGDLPARPKRRQAPVFIVQAQSAPDGAHLDRIQIVKVWLEGDRHGEKIYDVAKSDHTTGVPMLAAVWRDPDFDRTKPAAYYLRAFEIARPSQSAFSAIRERGWASPIWYTPSALDR